MRPNLKNKFYLLLAAGLVFSGAIADETAQRLSHVMNQLEEAVPAPDFSLEDMDGEKYTLSSFRGKTVLLNFWATWCPPCRKEMPSMEGLYQRFRDKGLVVIAVNQWETPDHVFSYMGDLNVDPTFPLLFDTRSEISEKYGVKGLPTSFIIDAGGRVTHKAIGGRDFHHPALIEQIESLL